MKQWQYDPSKKPMVRLSRTKVEDFLKCPRCFYLTVKLGVKRPSWPGWPLNVAVDQLLKKEFDIHRANGEAHPLMKRYGVKAVPFEHAKMDAWRENFEGVEYYDQDLNIEFCGAVDDIWQEEDERLIVVDYKATSTRSKIDLNGQYKKWYKKQVEFYQWLLRKNGFKVNDIAFFVYANGRKDEKAFDGKLEFDVELIEYEGNDSWVEPTLAKIKETLDSDQIPKADPECEYCAYRNRAKAVE